MTQIYHLHHCPTCDRDQECYKEDCEMAVETLCRMCNPAQALNGDGDGDGYDDEDDYNFEDDEDDEDDDYDPYNDDDDDLD